MQATDGATTTPARRGTRWLAPWSAFLLVVAVLAACGGDEPELIDVAPPAGDGTDDPAADGEPEDTPTPTPPPVTSDPTPTPPPPPVGGGEPAFNESSKVTTVGIDAIIFGMTVEEASAVQRTGWEALGAEGGTCYVVRPTGGPDGITLTIVDGRVERLDITNPMITTRSGAGVGSSPERLRELFGAQLFEEPSATGTTFQFVPVDDNDQSFRIYFETEGGAVTRYRVGRVPVVNPVAPCG